jgi:hypothetical protein
VSAKLMSLADTHASYYTCIPGLLISIPESL